MHPRVLVMHWSVQNNKMPVQHIQLLADVHVPAPPPPHTHTTPLKNKGGCCSSTCLHFSPWEFLANTHTHTRIQKIHGGGNRWLQLACTSTQGCVLREPSCSTPPAPPCDCVLELGCLLTLYSLNLNISTPRHGSDGNGVCTRSCAWSARHLDAYTHHILQTPCGPYPIPAPPGWVGWWATVEM